MVLYSRDYRNEQNKTKHPVGRRTVNKENPMNVQFFVCVYAHIKNNTTTGINDAAIR